MRLPGRPRFADVIRAQLDLYLEENADLLTRVAAAKQAYDRAKAPGAEEAYGVYMDAVEEAEDALLELRDRYAETMAARERGRYEREFSRAAERMLPTLQSRRLYMRAIDPDSTT
ncbi:MAG TPA: hypothetical protein VGL44_08880 [Gaiellales bacterium]|jgi:hypothetical protein